MKFLKFLPPLVILLSLLLLVSSSSCCNIPALFNFGDSNSDTGGFSAAFGPLPPPYGETYFGMPAGRGSDGRLIIDFIAESLGLPYLSSYLDSLSANFSHGANFAAVGSTIIDQNVTLSQGGYSPFFLDAQLKQFLQFKSRSQLVYNQGGVFKGLMPKEAYFPQALYTVDIGQNDLTAAILGNKSADKFIRNAMAEFSRVIKNIYEIGGRNFWIHNTGPLGCLPFFLVRVNLTPTNLDSAGCWIPYNKLAQQFNAKLYNTVIELRREFPLAAFTYVDVYSVKYLLISQAQKYGFEEPLTACCGYGGGKLNVDTRVRCGATGKNVDGTKYLLSNLCKNPLKRVSWDGVHYTEAAAKWVFDRISTGEYSDPPNSLNTVCHINYQD
ncbi:uncharacterized protein A4U43_C04F13940 [Asparagus officinalis]|uniref:Uncharacterized protein n=1 Tax=Asparagus officinalis TaxID=4686 RepID=A0A5P1F3E6_ASPOF|nr:GDSL esterase/lipase At3g26430-like [Asparagus officinalis]ONK71937.1 uncharacterized protein A4U43_C04F13940 [Asparagus officinalis]